MKNDVSIKPKNLYEIPHMTANFEFWSERSEEQNRNLRMLKKEADASGKVEPVPIEFFLLLVAALHLVTALRLNTALLLVTARPRASCTNLKNILKKNDPTVFVF
ncbi:MAG: hypothetical protein LBE57_02330 [Methanosarcinales archaeon]|jgi:hypothetical protein|nr:hypothetical protein [Methanosarcinales archaeon]